MRSSWHNVQTTTAAAPVQAQREAALNHYALIRKYPTGRGGVNPRCVAPTRLRSIADKLTNFLDGKGVFLVGCIGKLPNNIGTILVDLVDS